VCGLYDNVIWHDIIVVGGWLACLLATSVVGFFLIEAATEIQNVYKSFRLLVIKNEQTLYLFLMTLTEAVGTDDGKIHFSELVFGIYNYIFLSFFHVAMLVITFSYISYVFCLVQELISF